MDHYPEKNNGLTKYLAGNLQVLPGYSGLYLGSAFRNLGMNLISLFIPIYIFKISGSLVYIFLFYSFYNLVAIICDYPVAILVKYFGIDLIGFLGSLSRAGFLFLLIKAQGSPMLLWWGAIVLGLTMPLTWLPFHYSFTIAEKGDGKYGQEVGRLSIINKITNLVGPLAGGLIIASFGFTPLFYFALVLMIISGLPLFFDTIQGKGMRLSLDKITYHLTRNRRGKFWLSFTGGELESAVLGVVWPIFIFLIVKNYETVGLIKSMSTLVSVILIWFLGKWIDKRGKSIMHFGTLINSFNLLLRPFLTSPFALFLIDSAYDLTSDLVGMPFETAFYEEAIKMRKLEFMVEREFISHVSAMIACLVLGLMFILKIDWLWIFALGAVGVLLRGYILQEEKPWLEKITRIFHHEG